eukprot:TRINITY_DN6068_c0_g1_i2.p1 TRINITY_DN6068_c0_g1~~TRINITY_DN6068_c0_g1_i2.p1  ORF type:complete len:296 (-),score=83.28 TRINITY_DN6068_c0_g1_i2:48-935(-)
MGDEDLLESMDLRDPVEMVPITAKAAPKKKRVTKAQLESQAKALRKKIANARLDTEIRMILVSSLEAICSLLVAVEEEEQLSKSNIQEYVFSNRVTIVGKNPKPEELEGRTLIDLSEDAKGEKWHKLSIHHPHGNLKVPFGSDRSHDINATSVIGIWEALKVFEHEQADIIKLTETKPGHRAANETRGKLLGWQAGIAKKNFVMNLETAKKEILIPAYLDLVERHCRGIVNQLKTILKRGGKIVIKDDKTAKTMLKSDEPSSALLLKMYLDEKFPKEHHTARSALKGAYLSLIHI